MPFAPALLKYGSLETISRVFPKIVVDDTPGCFRVYSYRHREGGDPRAVTGFGWLMNISVSEADLEKAYNLIAAPLLSRYAMCHLVVDLKHLKESNNTSRCTSAQITVYLEILLSGTSKVEAVAPEAVAEMIAVIDHAFAGAGIRQGEIPIEDAQTKSKFCSLRNAGKLYDENTHNAQSVSKPNEQQSPSLPNRYVDIIISEMTPLISEKRHSCRHV